jgi:threonine dehydratase
MTISLPTYQDVLEAGQRLQGHVTRTPVLRNDALDEIAGARLFFKAECLQETGSFKLRGAMNRLLQIPVAKRAAGVVAFSSGNHAQGISRAAKRLGMPALIVMPTDAPAIKVAGVEADGAEIRLYDRATESREEIAAQITKARGAVLVPSFDDADIIAGQGTCGLELAAQMAVREVELDHLICCAGGGGLTSGIALALEGTSPATKAWTAEPAGHDDWRRSLAAGEVRRNADGTRSFCDAILTPQPGEMTWGIGSRLFSGGHVISDAQVGEAMRLAFWHLKLVVEPGGAAALAAALFTLRPEQKGSDIGVIISGGNVDPALFARVLGEG